MKPWFFYAFSPLFLVSIFPTRLNVNPHFLQWYIGIFYFPPNRRPLYHNTPKKSIRGLPHQFRESYNYNNNNGTLSSMLLGTGRTLSFEYDNLLRVSRRNVSGVYQHRRNYMGTGAANRQANQIQYFVYASADGADTKLNYRYDYDAGGNISEIYR